MTHLVTRNSQHIFDLLNDKDSFITSMDRIFDEMMNFTFPDFTAQIGKNCISKGSYPKCNVMDKPDKIVIEAAVPGLQKEDVSIAIEDDALIIKGDKVQGKEDSDNGFILRELKKSSFKRAFVLNDNLDKEKIDASYRDGILTIEILKKEVEKKKTKVIDIK